MTHQQPSSKGWRPRAASEGPGPSHSLVLLALLVGALACTPSAPPAEPAEPKPYARLADGLAHDRSLHGVWRSIGYGWILAIDADGFEVFHDLGAACLADSGQIAGFARYRLTEDDHLSLLHHDLGARSESHQAPNHFERLSALPPACVPGQETIETEPGALYELVGELFETHYATFEQRGVDWQALRARYRHAAQAATTPEALFLVLSDLIEPLHDGHVGLWLGTDRYFAPSQPGLRLELERLWQAQGGSGTANAFVSSWHRRVKASVIPLLVEGSYQEAAAGAIEWGRLSPRVGYLRINRFTRFAEGDADRSIQLTRLDEAMDQALRMLGDCSALVVDVAMNGGGFDAAALAVAGHFSDRERLAFTIAAAGQPNPVHQLLPPAEGARFLGDIYLLTSEITVSAAEAFVLAMRALPHVRHVGETTRGSLSGILPKPLPNGFMIKLAGQLIGDADGEVFEGRGIPPHRAMPIFRGGDVETGLVRALGDLRDTAAASVQDTGDQ